MLTFQLKVGDTPEDDPLLKTRALSNILSILVTLLVFQLLKFPLNKGALLNVLSIVVTLLVSQLKVVDTAEDAPLLKTFAPKNIN